MIFFYTMQRYIVSQVTVRPTMSGSPYKKPQSSAQLAKNRLASVSNPVHTSEEVERLKVIFHLICYKVINKMFN